jgi:hypothetical protein
VSGADQFRDVVDVPDHAFDCGGSFAEVQVHAIDAHDTASCRHCLDLFVGNVSLMVT